MTAEQIWEPIYEIMYLITSAKIWYGGLLHLEHRNGFKIEFTRKTGQLFVVNSAWLCLGFSTRTLVSEEYFGSQAEIGQKVGPDA